MRFSLIVPTRGRTHELTGLFNSLLSQEIQDFEVILSDQNDDDRLVSIVKASPLADRLIHIKSGGGASCARNAGLDCARGELLGFPDDDCTFPPGVLKQVSDFFAAHPDYGLLAGSSYADEAGSEVSRFDSQPGEIQQLKIHRQGIEFTTFIRHSALGDRRYDEHMGVGSRFPWHSDEGPDLTLRLQRAGVRCYYDPAVAIWHPAKIATYEPSEIDRAYRYALGTGYFYRKHHYPFWYCAYYFARAGGGAALAIVRSHNAKARFYFARCRGLWKGWRATPVAETSPGADQGDHRFGDQK